MLNEMIESIYRVDAENEEKAEYQVGQENQDEEEIEDDDLSCGRGR
jgi:hypothetical protein